MTRGAGGAGQRIAELVHRNNVGVVEQVKDISDEIHTETLVEVDALGNARVELKEHGHSELVAAERADATKRRSNSRNGERLEGVGQASCRNAEGEAVNVRRARAAAEVGASLGGTEFEASVFTRNDVERTAGGNFDEWSECPVAKKAAHEPLPGNMRRTLEDAAGDPAMALIVNGVALLVLREAAVLRFEGGL